MSEKDKQLIEAAYSAKYRSTIMQFIRMAETEECREALHLLLNDPEAEWKD